LAQAQGIPCFNVINRVESSIAKMTKCGVFLNAGREYTVASTKAFISQVVALCLVTHWFSEKKHPGEFIVERHNLIEAVKQISMKTSQALADLPD